jgi:hypothetical protein
MENKANLFLPVIHTQIGKPPLVIKAITQPFGGETFGGTYENPRRDEFYILLSVLPEDLQRRIEIAIQALKAQV